MTQMFDQCSSITSMDFSHLDTSNVTDMASMFNCFSLTTLNVSGWNTSNVTNMYDMFKGCTSLKTIRMVGCSEEIINKIRSVMPSGCTIVTE